MQDLAALEPGHTVRGANAAPPPLVLASPHSGRCYPPEFLAQSRLSLAQLRRAEDGYVDELVAGAPARGVPLIAGHYGRAWLDLNRSAEELDPAMFEPMPPAHPDQRGERVRAGLGVVPRVATQGLDIYATRLPLASAQMRLLAVHAPYHAALTALVARAQARHGYAILLDCHSMPALPPAPRGAAQVVLGDLFATSASAALVARIATWFRAAGLRVACNAPYAGGYTTERHGNPAAGVHAVQIELDRTLYMDPQRLQRGPGFARIGQLMTGLVEDLLLAAPQLDLHPPLRTAAE